LDTATSGGVTVTRTGTVRRYIFLDALRGIAVLAVFFQHAGARLFPSFSNFTSQWFQMGQFGVSVFFLCSGYIIPRSIEKKSTLTEFWVHRIFRLYPLYWVSLLLALAWGFTHVGFLPEAFYTHSLRTVIANFSMVQGLLGSPHALSPYWSLGFEMIFYWAMTALVFVKFNQKTFPIVMGLLALSVLNPLATRVLHQPAHVGIVFHFATLFFGTLIYRFESGSLADKKFLLALGLVPVVIIAANALAFSGERDVLGDGVHAFVPMTTAWVGAYLVFGLCFWKRWSGDVARALAWVGLISYSVYLLHPLVIEVGIFDSLKNPMAVFVIWTVLVFAVSALTYRLIEHPAIIKARALKINL
jgi:peptidoglycan/LPS O-acetylase OafA/YrhL